MPIEQPLEELSRIVVAGPREKDTPAERQKTDPKSKDSKVQKDDPPTDPGNPPNKGGRLNKTS